MLSSQDVPLVISALSHPITVVKPSTIDARGSTLSSCYYRAPLVFSFYLDLLVGIRERNRKLVETGVGKAYFTRDNPSIALYLYGYVVCRSS